MGLRKGLYSPRQQVIGLQDDTIQFTRVSFDDGYFLCKPHALVQEDGTLTPFAVGGSESLDYGDWITTLDIARIYGASGSLRVIYSQGGEYSTGPIATLDREITTSRTSNVAPAEWDSVFPKRDFNKGAAKSQLSVTRERGCTVFLATVVMKGREPERDGKLTLVQTSFATGKEMMDKLAELNLNIDYFGDLNLGLQIVAVPTKKVGQALIPNHFESNWVQIQSNLGWNPERYRANCDYIKTRKLGWHNLIKIPSDQEQVNCLVQSSIPPSAILYALHNYADLLPPKYREIAEIELQRVLNQKARPDTPEQVPAYRPVYHQPQQPMQQGLGFPPAAGLVGPAMGLYLPSQVPTGSVPQQQQNQNMDEADGVEQISPEMLQQQVQQLLSRTMKR